MPYKAGDPRASEVSKKAWETRRYNQAARKDVNKVGVKKVKNPNSSKSGLPKEILLDGKKYYNTLALAKKWKTSDNTILRLRKEQQLESVIFNHEIFTVDLKEGPSESRVKAARLREKRQAKAEKGSTDNGISNLIKEVKNVGTEVENLYRMHGRVLDFITGLEKKISDADTHIKLMDQNMTNSLQALKMEVAAIPREQFNGIKLKEVPPQPEPPKISAGPARLIKADPTKP